MTTTTRPCPHCGRDYDITYRSHGDVVWCLCGKWFAVVMRLDGSMYLSPCDAPDGTQPARETTADAALVAEMSALRAELEVVQAEAAVLRVAATQLYNQLQALRHPDMSTLWRLGGQPLEDAFEAQKAALISGAGRLLLDELEATREDNAALLNILEPFARFAGAQSIVGVGGEIVGVLPDRYIVARAHSEDGDIDLTLGDLRRARAVQQAEHPGRALTKRMSDLERERDAARVAICEILGEFSREMRYVPHEQDQRWRRAAGLSEIKGPDQ